MASLDDKKGDWYRQAVGSSSRSLNQLENSFYRANSGLGAGSLNDHKIAFFKANGATGASFNDLQRSYWATKSTSTAYQFYSTTTFGGAAPTLTEFADADFEAADFT